MATEIVEVEGVKFLVEDKLPKEGELYVVERNVGKQLLTAFEIVLKDEKYNLGYIIPKENAYCYDFHECKRVVKMIE